MYTLIVMRLPRARPRQLLRCLAVFCLLAPAFTVLAVQAHLAWAAHCDLRHHAATFGEADHTHSHGPHVEHEHRDSGTHFVGPAGHTQSADAEVDHDHHQHELQGPTADVALFRASEQAWSLPLLGRQTGTEAPDSERSLRQFAACNGVGPPAEHGALPVLHCSWLI